MDGRYQNAYESAGRGYQQQGGYGQQDGGRPHPPEPWVAEWDGQQNTWIFINRQTGERSYRFPMAGGYGQERQGYGAPQGYGSSQGYGPSQGYGSSQGYGPSQGYGGYEQEQKPSHTGRNVALGAAAGLVGGALLMHEGHEIRDDFERDKYQAEYDADRAEGWAGRKFDDGVNDVENFPDDAARWTGDKVQEVEDIPEDVDRKWDDAKQDVEDVPYDMAQAAGDVDGRLDRFGDGLADSYDQGRDQGRNDDW